MCEEALKSGLNFLMKDPPLKYRAAFTNSIKKKCGQFHPKFYKSHPDKLPGEVKRARKFAPRNYASFEPKSIIEILVTKISFLQDKPHG